MPDYQNYSLVELEDSLRAVNREKYPDNFKAIVEEISKRTDHVGKSDLPTDSSSSPSTPEHHETSIFSAVKAQAEEQSAESPTLQHLSANDPEKPVDELPSQAPAPPKMSITFNGSAKEYFKIWIVNLCLSLATLGIFSAWAKVRKKRYLYSNLTLDGTPFQYLGQPIPILKGRLIAAAIFTIYYFCRHLFPPMLPYIFAVGLVAAPWVLIQSASFNARYTAFRNITFNFKASYLDALKILSAWGLVPAIIITMIFEGWGKPWLIGVLSALAGLLFPFWLRGIKKLIVTKTSYGGKSGEFGATGGQFFSVYFGAGLLSFAIIAIAATTAFTTLGSSSFRNVTVTVYFITAVSYLGYLLAYAVIQAGLTNIVWNSMRLGPISFNCTLKFTELSKIYITNVMAIIFSAGLLIPWAVIRTFRYRIEKTEVIRDGELDMFSAHKADNVKAAGAEITDFFDMDLSI